MSVKPDNVILQAVLGSTAYGLATENSDIDIKGVYTLPLRKVLSMSFDANHTTIDHVNPDWVFYEVGKFMKLVVGGNPTVSELLWVDDYMKISPVGEILVKNRDAFLSTKAVMNAYRGYAMGQAKKLSNRQAEGLEGYDSALKNRFSKHTRHCFRLLLQCRELLETGHLHVKVTPEQREWLFAMGNLPPDQVVDRFIEEDGKMNAIVSVLPDAPDQKRLDDMLFTIRHMA